MTLNIAAYGQGSTMYPLDADRIKAIKGAGWTTLILGFLHIDTEGDIYFSETKIICKGRYIGCRDWPTQLGELLGEGSTITNNLLAGIGGAKTNDFQNIASIYRRKNTFDGTTLKENFQKLYKKFTSIGTIEMDVEEDTVDPEAFVAFCLMLHGLGFYITFCPYTDQSFWVDALVKIHAHYPSAVKWWDLQCYDGGCGNDPQEWAEAIKRALPDFDTTGFIMASDWSRFWDDSWQTWCGHCPQAMQDKLHDFQKELCVGGAFVWNLGSILNYAKNQKDHPDPQWCGDVGMVNYVKAIKDALG